MLTPKQVAEGINITRQNALRLYNDAKVLFEADCYQSSLALAAIAIEEAGKAAILREIACGGTAEELKARWNTFRRHTAKNGAWIFPDLAKKGARKLEEFQKTVARDSEHNEVLESLKQLSLYADCFGDAAWSLPSAVVTKELAEIVLFSASILAANETQSSEREIDLWVEIVCPKINSLEGASALFEWNSRLQSEGLSTISDEEWRSFLGEMLNEHQSSGVG